MSDTIRCQGCGRMLTALRDGTARRHNNRPGGYHCQSSGYRLARWDVGQRLRHHTGDLWVIRRDDGGEWGDYWLECIAGREKGRQMTGHGEYLHRHGWTAVSAGSDGETDT